MIGHILNHRYRVTDLIGTGGMAHVYRAVNIGTRKSVAIKVLKEEYKDDPEFLRRFEREARAVLHLSHDNIVRAYGVGEEDGLPFIVLEYVEGQTIKNMIKSEGALPPKEAVEYAYQVLDALSAAHNAGIIHRDIKPQNVIVTKGGKAKLTDFGIARETSSDTMTYAGATVLGSVHYLSPEQAKGVPTSVQSDIYSTGILLYEMLCGEVPFSGDNSVSIALKHINEAPEPLIQKNPMIAPALNDVVMKAISKKPEDRYESAAAMRSDLLRAQYDPYGDFARKPLPEAPVSKPKSSPKKRLHINWLYPITTGVLLILVILVVIFLQSRERFEEESQALEIVPVLTARTVADASYRAENYGFTFEVQDYETSDTVPYGNVILQTPESGTNALPGTVIYGIVSLGPDAPTVPDLLGMTPDEALAALAAEGLALGKTSYMVSDVALGYVCMQSPVGGTETQPGQIVDISVSSAAAENIPMPELTNLSIDEALAVLAQGTFQNVRVRETLLENVPDNLVTVQSPLPTELVLPSALVELTVNVAHTPQFAADFAFNLDIAASGTPVMVTLLEARGGAAYERVLYEATLEKGEKVPVSLTARSDAEGLMETRLYVSGERVRSAETSFTYREP